MFTRENRPMVVHYYKTTIDKILAESDWEICFERVGKKYTFHKRSGFISYMKY